MLHRRLLRDEVEPDRAEISIEDDVAAAHQTRFSRLDDWDTSVPLVRCSRYASGQSRMLSSGPETMRRLPWIRIRQ